MIDRDRIVLPEPDSPTTPRVLPRSRLIDTPSTARTVPRSVRKWVLRSTTRSSLVARVLRRAARRGRDDLLAHRPPSLTSRYSRNAIAGQVEGQHGEEHHGAGDEADVGLGLQCLAAVVDHAAPGRRGRFDRQAEEGQAAFGDDGDGHADDAERQHREDHVRHDLLPDQARVARAQRPRCGHVLALAVHQRRRRAPGGRSAGWPRCRWRRSRCSGRGSPGPGRPRSPGRATGRGRRAARPSTTSGRDSTLPLKKPETMPIVPPISRPNRTDATPTVSETRAPQQTRAKMSRPNVSVPNQCSGLGG